jgi:hypothetical protein
MASKVETWAVFDHFNITDIDQTFKRGLGSYSRPLNAEQPTLPDCPAKGRTQCTLQMQSDLPWVFHHRDAPSNGQRRGPMLRCRSAEECSYDKVTASLACDLFGCAGFEGRPMSKRRPGQFSPEASATGVALTKTYVPGDFESRGICDIDRNLKRGVGSERRACATTVDNEEMFSEEQHAMLKSSLSKLSERDQRLELPDFVQDLGRLGIECRRLQSSNFSEQRSMFIPYDQSKLPEGSKKFTPVLERGKASKLKQRAVRNTMKAKWVDESNNLNINTYRLASLYANVGLHESRLPKHALPKCLEKLVSEAGEKKYDTESSGETCSTFDEECPDESRCQMSGILIPKLDLGSLEHLDLNLSIDANKCALRRCRTEGIIIPKLDLRGIGLRTSSDASTCCAESNVAESFPASPCSACQSPRTSTFFTQSLSEQFPTSARIPFVGSC